MDGLRFLVDGKPHEDFPNVKGGMAPNTFAVGTVIITKDKSYGVTGVTVDIQYEAEVREEGKPFKNAGYGIVMTTVHLKSSGATE